MCAHARLFLNHCCRLDPAAVIFSSTCDQMRRAFDLFSFYSKVPSFLFNVPATWQNLTAQKLYRLELLRLGRFMQSIGGIEPSISALAGAFGTDNQVILGSRTCDTSSKLVAVIGEHRLAQSSDLFNLIEQLGGRVVLDALGTSGCTSPAKIEMRSFYKDPLEEITSAYFGTIPSIFRRPNIMFYSWLRNAFVQNRPHGLLIQNFTWCDIWKAEIDVIKKQINIPVLEITIADTNEYLQPSIINRIEAFMETLK
ncbi:MAG: hypothetical protein A2Y07_04330 [Planctomycetes bacterium GWF2_50_10]|nr:MAG: hypothetical protein A2Y07_04330 [Planctomycetes bacterium GWF2_50_10]